VADLPPGGRLVKLGEAVGRRKRSAQARLAAAAQRDASASARDVAAVARDEVAAVRHLAVVQRSAASARDGARTMSAAERIIRAAGQRKRAERLRAEAAEQDALAEQDRSAQDREQAAFERLHALVDRELLADALAGAEVDALTGARMRAAGMTDLERELLCCHRTSRSLVVACVDVVGFKALNDSANHAAADELLVQIVALVKQHLRAYDLIIRVGGNAFLCAMTAMPLADVRRRFNQIAAALAAAPGAAAIRTGCAELVPDETITELIARADGELRERPHADHGPREDPPAATG
jgi:diguanylate cyclase (GGDEF)-like protein